MLLPLLFVALAALAVADVPLDVVSVTLTAGDAQIPVRMSATTAYRIRRDLPFTLVLRVRLAKGVANPCPGSDAGCTAVTDFMLHGEDGKGAVWISDSTKSDQIAFGHGYTFEFCSGPLRVPDDILRTGPGVMEWRFTKDGTEFFVYRVNLAFSAPLTLP